MRNSSQHLPKSYSSKKWGMAWKKHDSRIVYENDWMAVREDRVTNPGGGENLYGGQNNSDDESLVCGEKILSRQDVFGSWKDVCGRGWRGGKVGQSAATLQLDL